MAVDVMTTIVIERPIAEVAAYAGDPSNAPTWYRRIDDAEWETEPPIMLGSRIAFRARCCLWGLGVGCALAALLGSALTLAGCISIDLPGANTQKVRQDLAQLKRLLERR